MLSSFRVVEDVISQWAVEEGAAIQFVCSVRGREVSNVAAGYDDDNNLIDQQRLFCVMSASKAVAALVMLYLRAQGCYEPDERITRWWPRFGRHGKEGATVAHVLSHRLGLPRLTTDHRLWGDREHMRTLVEEARPDWRPGERFGYHGGIFGPVLDELVHRWTGESMGAILQKELCAPMGIRDCFMGLPRDAGHRIVPLRFLESNQMDAASKVVLPPFETGWFNDPDWLSASNPSSGVVASASALVQLLDILAHSGYAGGRRYWGEALQRDAERARNTPEEASASATLPGAAFGLGFLVAPTPRVFGVVPMSRRTLGHIGATGAVVCADSAAQVTYAFTINGVGGSRALVRCQRIGDLVAEAVGRSEARS